MLFQILPGHHQSTVSTVGYVIATTTKTEKEKKEERGIAFQNPEIFHFDVFKFAIKACKRRQYGPSMVFQTRK